MAITDSQKIDYLFKKIGYGVAKTDVSTIKSPSNEPNPSPLLLRGENVWQQSSLITTVSTLPTANSNVMSVYRDTLSSTVQTVNDGTASVNRTWKTNLTDWISPEFGSGYAVKVYTGAGGNGSPQTLASLPADGSGNNDSWYFDYQSGILNFADTNVPTAVTGNVVYISGARYVGSKGVSNFPNGLTAGNITFGSNTINSSSGNVYIGTTLTVLNAGDVSANIGVLYANAITQQGTLNSINANIGAYETWANANAASQATTLITLDANIGAYETYANANALSQQTQIVSLATNANANTAAYLPNYSGSLGGTLTTVTQNNVTTMTGLVTIGSAGVTTTVAGNLTVGGNLTVSGNSVNIGSTSLSIQDPIINLHTASDLTPLTTNDGADIGVKFHYYTVALGDSHAFLGRTSDTGYLEWYDTGNDTANVFTGVTYGTVKSGALILANARATGGGLLANTGTLQVWGDGSLSGNSYVGGTLTILNAGDVSANIGVLYANAVSQQGSINTITANIGAYYTWANANLVSQQGDFNTLNANVGAYETWANANLATQTTNFTLYNTWANANLVSQQGNYNTLNANVGAYETWANANLSTQTTNLSLYQTWANANLVSQQGNYNTLNANVGAYETSVNANLATQQGNFNTLNANVGVLYSGNISTQANIGLIYANLITQQGNFNTLNANVGTTQANIGTIYANLSAQQGSYNTLNANVGVLYSGNISTQANIGTIYANLATQTTNFNTLNANVGAYEVWANANLSSQTTNFNTLNANVGAYETWANANLAGHTTSLNSINANIGAYETWANANLATQQTQLTSLTTNANANVAAYLTTYTGNISASNITISGTVIANTVNAATIGNTNSNIVGSGAYITNIAQSNISIYSGVTNVTTGTYYPILSSQTSSGNIKLAINGNVNYVANTSTLNVANLTVSGNTSLSGATILNAAQTDSYGTIIRGVTDSTLLWANPRTTYDQVLIGGSATSSTPVTGAKLQINSTDSMLLPMGDNASRPGTPRSGMFRYNTQINVIEWYDATIPGWTYPTTASGSSSQNNLITNQSYTGNGSTAAFTLPTSATTSGLLVSINGVIQIPVQAYSVSGATLTFVTAPGLNDLIDVRILVPAVAVTSISDNAGNTIQLGSTGISFITANLSARTWNLTGAEVSTLPAVLVATSGVATELDRFDITTYSSAEYTVTGLVQGSSIRMVAKVLVVHNGTTAYVDPFAITATSGNTIATFSGTITGSNLILQATTTNNNTSFRLRKNYQAI